ncbi:MAG: hypothetical protein WC455_28400 [Dehalococcoidia bacterium]|jgi:hypothetical protein
MSKHKYEISYLSIDPVFGTYSFITTYDKAFAIRKRNQFRAEGRLVSFWRS